MVTKFYTQNLNMKAMDNYWYNFKVNFNTVDKKNQNEIDGDF